MSALLERLRRPSISNAPPSDADLRRNDWVTIAWVLFILFLGFGIRNNALSAGETVTLGDNLIQFTVPAGWVRNATTTGSAADSTSTASPLSVAWWNPRSAGAFDAVIEAHARRLRPGENLMMGRATLGLQRSQDLSRYRELQAEPVTVLGLVPGTRITYAYIADPTRAGGALGAPVVVLGQDLLFVYRDHLIQVTVAADNARWEDEARAFDLVFDSLRLQEALP